MDHHSTGWAWSCVCHVCCHTQDAISIACKRPALCPTSSWVSRVCPGSSYSFLTWTFFSPAAPLAPDPVAAGFSSSFIAFLLGSSAEAGRFLAFSAELGRAALGLAAFACRQKGRGLNLLAVWTLPLTRLAASTSHPTGVEQAGLGLVALRLTA